MDNQAGGPRPTTIRIFLADGTPEGVRTVDKSNWTGKAIVANRPDLPQALKREEMNGPGIYVLSGRDEEGNRRLYVGEAEVLKNRLPQHSEKEFWRQMIAFTSTNASLNKALVKYLESSLIEIAQRTKQWELENGNVPAKPQLNEVEAADVEGFLAEMLPIFPILRVDAFEGNEPKSTGPRESALLYLRLKDAEGTGKETSEGFVVLANSLATKREVPSIPPLIRDLRKTLVERGVLVPNDTHLVFQQDYRFKSPSMAGAVLIAGACGGPTAWKTESGVALKSLQEQASGGPRS
jgi:hypothetical protein